MRPLLVFALVSPLVAGCTPYLPMRADFGTSALAPAGDIPPEYAAFNTYDPAVNPLLAAQICATEYQPKETVTNDAQPGRMVTTRGVCATHQPFIGN